MVRDTGADLAQLESQSQLGSAASNYLVASAKHQMLRKD
jgi:hypothetical protein